MKKAHLLTVSRAAQADSPTAGRAVTVGQTPSEQKETSSAEAEADQVKVQPGHRAAAAR